MATTMTQANGNGRRDLTIKDHLASDAMKRQIAAALPKHCSADRMARVAITAMTRVPKLAECDQKSFFQALLQLSQWGLEPDGRRAHLIPFRNNKLGITECQLIIDYKGLVELAWNSGQVASIHADIVCENDIFEADQGEVLTHKIDLRKDRGPMYAAYAKVKLVSGAVKCEVMSKKEIDAVRARSRAGNSGPWVSDYNEMAKKTVFRRLTKWLPLSAEVRDASYGDDDTPVTIAAETFKPQAKSLDALADRLDGKTALPAPSEDADEPFDSEGNSDTQSTYAYDDEAALAEQARRHEQEQ